MEHGVGREILAEPAVEGGERVRRGKAALEQQPHRVALVAEGGLDADEDVAEALAQHEDRAAVALLAAGGGAPLCLDLGEPALAADVVVGGDAGVDVGVRAEAGTVAAQDTGTQVVHRGRDLDAVARGLHALQRVVERLEDREIGGGAGAAGIRREAEEDDGDLPFGDAAFRRSAMRRPTRAASMSARSGWHRHIRGSLRRPSGRPPNRIGAVAPSSSGIATIMVASSGVRPRSAAAHSSSDWNSIAWAAT